MKIINADFLYTPHGYVQNQAVAFTEIIKDIGPLEELTQRYPDAEVIRTEPHSILYPGFINTHVHLEFSANKTSLLYGAFKPWLDSVIEHREELMGACNNAIMLHECQNMLRSGITAFGAISSFGNELEVCEKTPQRVVFFNELIGSNAMYADMLYGDFQERVRASQSCDKRARITPAIAIHSPYSVHPILLQKAVTLAKKHTMPLSTHFLESKDEREWLESSSGTLRAFFLKYFNTTTTVTNIEEFMHAFDTYPTHFAHCVQATEEELDYLAHKGHSIAHCPRSNRYLGCGRLAIEDLNLPFSVATDGLSSNDSLNIFDELKAAIMLHHDIPIQELSEKLLRAVTGDAAEILGLNCGKIEVDKLADFAVVTLPEAPKRTEELALWSILHTKEVSEVYIEGEKYV
ncbi:metal-dependent hydrolase [Sulfurovum sp. TSL1]|uniref:aminofutalosine deaminase family hydrolase n=1 Tax=Sulfurovum sp. TSL1 TaxID=2826994 RepID=UPI001CC6E967|nr:metal-dependent hydrolase [Sulfurovum sp. TSL1]GIT97448.1 chlorohydrolase [Sulfurovum sp. TSL1]